MADKAQAKKMAYQIMTSFDKNYRWFTRHIALLFHGVSQSPKKIDFASEECDLKGLALK